MPYADNEIIDDLLSLDGLDGQAVFMKAYFDESGKHLQAEVISVAGITAPTTSWKTLQNRWDRILRHHGVTPPFHASDCEVGTKKFAWKGELREALQADLIEALAGLKIRAGAISIIRKDYDALTAEDLRPTPEYRDIWFLAFEAGIGEVMAKTAKDRQILTLIFDRQDEFAPRAQQLYTQILAQNPAPSYVERLGTLAFSPKDKVAALQAVDLIVYEVNLHVRQFHLNGVAERWQSKHLRHAIDIFGVCHNFITPQSSPRG